MTTKDIYLMRHGEILTQGKKIFVGQTDLPLNEQGLRQAAWWRRKLADISFSRIYCSDLVRSQRTAQIIAGEKQDYLVIPLLKEISLGKWDGVEVAKIRSRFPEEFRKRGEHIANYRPPGGESFADLQKRVVPVWDSLVQNMEGNILIVAHAGVNRVILCYILGMNLANIFRLGQDYGSLTIIKYTKNSFQIRAFNITLIKNYLC